MTDPDLAAAQAFEDDASYWRRHPDDPAYRASLDAQRSANQRCLERMLDESNAPGRTDSDSRRAARS